MRTPPPPPPPLPPPHVWVRWGGADCEAADSAWAMEDRKACNSSHWVNLDKGAYDEDNSCSVAPGTSGAPACLFIDFTVSV